MAQVIHKLVDKGKIASFMITNSGTAVSGVTIIDASSLEGAITGEDQRVRITHISCLNAGKNGDPNNYSIQLHWDATPDQLALTLPMGKTDSYPGLIVVDDPSLTDSTGDLLITTTAEVQYTLFITVEKYKGYFPSKKYNRGF
tara:strand:- start:4258 stop:4686 length:429 start_codon:yes stop_codon:yes gene_type:complete